MRHVVSLTSTITQGDQNQQLPQSLQINHTLNVAQTPLQPPELSQSHIQDRSNLLRPRQMHINHLESRDLSRRVPQLHPAQCLKILPRLLQSYRIRIYTTDMLLHRADLLAALLWIRSLLHPPNHRLRHPEATNMFLRTHKFPRTRTQSIRQRVQRPPSRPQP